MRDKDINKAYLRLNKNAGYLITVIITDKRRQTPVKLIIGKMRLPLLQND